MTGRPKTGDELLVIVLGDITYIFDKFSVTVIAWCTDDGPDGKKMRHLLAVKLPWIIVIVCWAHQMNLVVGKFLKDSPDFRIVIVLGLDIVKWFNNHSGPLSILRKEQTATYDGKCWALILPVITRWTLHYLSLSRLLQTEGALRACVWKHKDTLLAGVSACDKEAMTAANAVLRTIEDGEFWVKITK